MTAQDVIFSFQAMAWSTESTGITSSIWWPAAKWPLWNSTANGGSCASAMCVSHVGVVKGTAANSVVFHLAQPYALFFYDTMFDVIAPAHVWASHMLTAAPINYSDPNLNSITDSFDRSIDFAFGATGQLAAAMGTGPLVLTSWTRGFNSTVRVNPNYWGKNVASANHIWAGKTYPFYPQHVTTIQFVVYGSLDVVSLALQKGEVDTLLWSLTPGFVTQVQSNPGIGIATSTDSGYFYLSFNMRKAPWNDLCMRQAVSMAIDKNYIVQTLLGGFGTAGTVPIGQTNQLYVNSSATTNADFNEAGIDAKLNGCGYIKNPNTGFYTMPDGTPISASILTPPKDYDPVRADAGIMISNNLKAAGLDIDVAPTSFDTIVTKAFTQPVDFDIYILGWSLGDFPETYLCSFFCGSQDVNLNPAGSNSAGYHSATVDSLIQQIGVTIDTTARVKLVKQVEGIVTAAIPWNILYYRKNINAFRTDTWQGWIPVSGGGSGNLGIYNFWSLMTLAPAGTPTSVGSSGAIQVALSVPDQVYARETVPIAIYTSQNQAPAAGASVSVNISSGTGPVACTASITVNCYNATTYTSDASGHVALSWAVPVMQGNIIVAVSASKGGVSGTNTKVMESTIGPPLPIAQLMLSTAKPVIAPGGTATITAKVTDGEGAPIAGAPITVDSHLLLGTVAPLTGTTSAAGTLALTYTAPSIANWPVPNGHLLDYVVAETSVANTIIGTTQKATQVMSVQNDAAPAWFVVTTAAPTAGFEVNPLATSTTINVHVNRFDGSAVGAGFVVDSSVTETNETAANNVTVTASQTTDASGAAAFTVTETAAAIAAKNNTNVFIRFFVHGAANTTSDEVMLLVWGGAATTTVGYSAQMSFTERTMDFSPNMAENNATVKVWDQLGVAKSGVPVFFQINYGPLGVPAQFPYTYAYANSKCAGSLGNFGTGCFPGEYNATAGSGANLDMNEAGGGSLGGVFQNSSGPSGFSPSDIHQGAAYGVENWFNDLEIENDAQNFATNTTIDACDPSTWPAGFGGEYFMNATSVTGATGTFSTAFFGLPLRVDSDIQVRAYISQPGKVAQAISDLWTTGSCGFAFAYGNAMRIDSGVVSQRAPMVGLGSVATFVPKYSIVTGVSVPTNTPTSTPAPAFSSQQPAVTLVAHFYALNGASPGPFSVMLVNGVGSAARDVLGGPSKSQQCFGQCALETNSNGYLNHTFTTAIFSLSQFLEFTWVDADAHWASGGREQLYTGCTAPCFDPANNGNEFGDYWLSPTFTSLLNKVAFTVDLPYMYLPTSTAFLTVQTNGGLFAPGSSGTATVHVYSVLTGAPIGGASVWSGNVSTDTDATGTATINFAVTQLGAVENLIIATTPYGGFARGWFSYVSSLPVPSFSALSITTGTAGSATTINDTLTNTIPLAGSTTVWLFVNGAPVVAKQVTLTSLGTAAVSFSYVFASAGTYNVTVGTSSAQAAPQSITINAPAPVSTGVDPMIAYGLAGGLLVVGLVVGVVVGMMMLRRRKPPAMPTEGSKPAEEELGQDEQL